MFKLYLKPLAYVLGLSCFIIAPSALNAGVSRFAKPTFHCDDSQSDLNIIYALHSTAIDPRLWSVGFCLTQTFTIEEIRLSFIFQNPAEKPLEITKFDSLRRSSEHWAINFKADLSSYGPVKEIILYLAKEIAHYQLNGTVIGNPADSGGGGGGAGGSTPGPIKSPEGAGSSIPLPSNTVDAGTSAEKSMSGGGGLCGALKEPLSQDGAIHTFLIFALSFLAIVFFMRSRWKFK